MALNYKMTTEDRAKERATRTKKLKDWPHAELTERVLTILGRRLEGIQEITEDVLVALGRQTDETAEATRMAVMMPLRRQHGAILEAWSHFGSNEARRAGLPLRCGNHGAAVRGGGGGDQHGEALKALLKERAEAVAGGKGPIGSREREATSAWQWHGWQ